MSEYNRKLTKEEIEKIGEKVVGRTFGELGDFKYNLTYGAPLKLLKIFC